MKPDLIERLRFLAADDGPFFLRQSPTTRDALSEASKEIERLREALKPFALRCAKDVRADDTDGSGLTVKVKYLRQALAALQPILPSGGGREEGSSSPALPAAPDGATDGQHSAGKGAA